MAQAPLAAATAKNTSNVLSYPNLDADGNLMVADQNANNVATSSALNKTAAAVIKASAGRAVRVTIIAPGSTSGAFTLNDCAATGDAAAANVIWTLPYNGTANVAGATFELNWPCATGITLSEVPGGGSPIIAISYV